jgi:hypothetical protein
MDATNAMHCSKARLRASQLYETWNTEATDLCLDYFMLAISSSAPSQDTCADFVLRLLACWAVVDAEDRL